MIKRELLKKQTQQLKEHFCGLDLAEIEPGKFIVKGNLGFEITYKGEVIRDDYDIEVIIPNDFPDNPPFVKETGNKIPKHRDYHVNISDGTLCLGAPIAVKNTFAKQRSLLWFIEKQVVPFLFGISYKIKHGEFPFGELSHGAKGLLEHYKELFSVKSNLAVLELLWLLAIGNYDESDMCPCDSGLKIKKCHRKVLKKTRNRQRPEDFYNEYLSMLMFLNI
jgi:hypothetical protein